MECKKRRFSSVEMTFFSWNSWRRWRLLRLLRFIIKKWGLLPVFVSMWYLLSRSTLSKKHIYISSALSQGKFLMDDVYCHFHEVWTIGSLNFWADNFLFTLVLLTKLNSAISICFPNLDYLSVYICVCLRTVVDDHLQEYSVRDGNDRTHSNTFGALKE